ncbi:uncharacterized protein LOC135137293 [Zophobas morio]|uniref:uncharacterized protein LOC135137293 n=1 Tax=Zophobas morio TaxID=2755281 RepID=UPI003083201D
MNPQKCCCHNKLPSPPGYYWRDYTGEIPEDAFPAGLDANTKPTYIGQAYLAGVGLIVTNVYPGQTTMNLPYYQVHPSDVGMKILCSSNPNSLFWENVTNRELPSTTAGKEVIIGGYQTNVYRMILNIGRVLFQGELIVGKVTGNHPTENKAGQGILYFVAGGQENSVNSYQVLLYDSSK